MVGARTMRARQRVVKAGSPCLRPEKQMNQTLPLQQLCCLATPARAATGTGWAYTELSGGGPGCPFFECVPVNLTASAFKGFIVGYRRSKAGTGRAGCAGTAAAP